MKKTFFLPLSVLLLIVVLTACQSKPADYVSGFVTPGGVKVEMLYPENTAFLLKIGTDDQGQIDRIRSLGMAFPEEFGRELYRNFVESAQPNLEKIGVSFENDLLPAVGGARIMLGMTLPTDTVSDPSVLAAVLFHDPDKVDQIIQKGREGAMEETQTYRNFTLYTTREANSYITRYNDLFLLSNDLSFLKQALDRADAKGSLLSSGAYQQGLTKMVSGVAYLFVNQDAVRQLIQNDAASQEELKGLMDSDIMKFMIALRGEMYFVSAEDDGLRIAVYSYGDEEQLKNLSYNFLTMDQGDAYLYKRLPGTGVMMYSEGGNMKTSLAAIFDLYERMSELKPYVTQIREFFASQDIDSEKDFLGMLDKGFALSIVDNGTLFPHLLMGWDASSNPESAKKIMALIAKTIDAFLQQGYRQNPELKQYLTQEGAGDSMYSLRFFVNEAAKADETALPELSSLVLELQYGVDSDHLAFFAVHPVLIDSAFDTLDKNGEFAYALNAVNGKSAGLFYMEPPTIMRYIDRIVDVAAREGGTDEEALKSYRLLKEYVLPVRSVIFVGASRQAHQAEAEGFIHIAVPSGDSAG